MMSCLTLIRNGKVQERAAGSFLERAAQIEGLYVPIFYDAEYNEDGTLKSFTPNNEYASAVVKKQIVMDVTDAPLSDETGCSFYQSNAGQSCS